MANKSHANLVLKNVLHKIVKYFGIENEKTPEQSSKRPALPGETGGGFPDAPLMLIDIFKEEEKYHYLFDILAQKKMVSPETDHWIDFKNGKKKLIVVIIKQLYVLGYYKGHKQLTHLQIQDICYNTFGIEVTIDHIKHIKTDDMDVSFLPPSHQILLSSN